MEKFSVSCRLRGQVSPLLNRVPRIKRLAGSPAPAGRFSFGRSLAGKRGRHAAPGNEGNVHADRHRESESVLHLFIYKQPPIANPGTGEWCVAWKDEPPKPPKPDAYVEVKRAGKRHGGQLETRSLEMPTKQGTRGSRAPRCERRTPEPVR